MAYTIKVHGNESDCLKIQSALREAIKEDGRFRLQIEYIGWLNRGKRDGSRKPGYAFRLNRVRLVEAKPYCGQHAPPCVINPFTGPRKLMKATYLEWDDWVELHHLVNDVLDQGNVDADVWTMPLEVRGTMWIRKGMARRIRYDYENIWRQDHWAPIQKWNLGTADQFRR